MPGQMWWVTYPPLDGYRSAYPPLCLQVILSMLNINKWFYKCRLTRAGDCLLAEWQGQWGKGSDVMLTTAGELEKCVGTGVDVQWMGLIRENIFEEWELENIIIQAGQRLRWSLRSDSQTVLNTHRSAWKVLSTCALRKRPHDIMTLGLHGMLGQEARAHDPVHHFSSLFLPFFFPLFCYQITWWSTHPMYSRAKHRTPSFALEKFFLQGTKQG